MCAFTLLSIAITIWASTVSWKRRADWSEIIFFILIGLIALFFIFVLVWEFKLRNKLNAYVCKFIAEGFYSEQSFLNCTTEANIEILLAGDKLVAMREGCPATVQFDLTPVKSYVNVCASITRRAKEFLRVYYSARTERPTSVKLTDRTQKRAKEYVYVTDGQPTKDVKSSYFIKHGII